MARLKRRYGIAVRVATAGTRVSAEGATNLYQFTDANTGETHQWWVRKSDAAVERIKIGEKVDLKITVK